MGHYAKVKGGKVIKVISARPSFFNNFVDDSPGKWLQTSYNTRGGLHYQANSNLTSSVFYTDASGSMYDTLELANSANNPPVTTHKPGETLALRGNFAGVGYEYDKTVDAFFAPKPYNSWLKNTGSFSYEAPVDYPTGDLTGSYTGSYDWDESITNWVTSSLGI